MENPFGKTSRVTLPKKKASGPTTKYGLIFNSIKMINKYFDHPMNDNKPF